MTITRQPESLCLTGNMASIRVITDTDITMTLTSGNDELLTHTYSPTADNIVDINLRDVIMSLLSCQLSNTSSPYQQTMICRSFTVTLTDGTDTETVNFKALRAGVDNLSDTVGNFLQHNFLTWQPNVKPVTYYTPEFLTYYAQQQVVVKCLAHIAEGNETTVTLATISADTCVTIPVQYAIIAGLTNALPQWYDVWVETGGGTRLTYKQRYYAQDMRSEQEQWILFENSLGGIDTFRAYGDSDNTAEHTHNVAEIEEVSQEYRVDTERKYKKSTGRLDRNERLWLLDFFPSTRKYIYIGQSLRQIVVVESDVNYKASELPSSYTFTYRYADAKPYLNLPRTDVPLEVLDIQVPDVGSFTVAPRLVEFPATPLSDGALFPVQDPYSEEWGTTTFGAIRQIIAAMVSTAEESFAILTHTHLNKSFLDGLSWDSIRNHFAQSFLSKTNADTANGVITFVAGLVSNAIAWFKQGIKIGSDANSPLGIDAAGNATLNSVTSDDIHSDGYSDDTAVGSGFHIRKDAQGNGVVSTDILDVRKKARFTELEIRRLSYINAENVQSAAASKLEKVLPVAADGSILTDDYDDEDIYAYRCLVLADDGTTATTNSWAVGDQARCQTFNVQSGVYQNVENRYYWRLVVKVGQCMDDGTVITQQTDLSEYTGRIHHFFDLANIVAVTRNDCDEWDDLFAAADTAQHTGNAFIGMDNAVNITNDAPSADDQVVQMGHQFDISRMGFYVTKAEGLDTGSYVYAGVNTYSLELKNLVKIAPREVLVSSRHFRLFTNPNAGDATPITRYRGDWTDGSTSYYYDEWDYNGSRWLCLYQGAEGITCEPGTVPQGDTTHAWTYYWKEISLKGDSVKIAGYADYYDGEDWQGNARPQTVTETEVGLIDLLDYHSTQEDMIEVGEEGESDWQAYSVPIGTCYILKGTNHLYEATENGWRDLGKFKGEDGAPAPFYIEEWYAWSNDASTANATTSPNIGNNSWEHYIPEQGSYAYLWKKTVRWEWNSTLKIYRAGNPQYYRLSGTNGTSIAVKGHVATTSNLPATHSDGDAYVVDADGHLYMWSDEANQWLDIGQFQGENGRTYYVHIAWATNVVYSEQTGEVTRVDGFVIAKTPDDDTHYWMGVLVNENSSTDSNDALLYTWSYTKGVNGTSPWIADLDNEMDSVACDADGHPVQINGNNQSVSSNFKLFHGSTEEKFYISSVSPSSRTGATIAATPTTKANAATSGSLTVTYYGTGDNRATIDGKDEFTVELTADSDSNIKRTLTFTVNGVRPGADGQPATIYKIKPTVNSIAFGRDANGNLTPNIVSFYLECEKSQGGTITNPAISYVGIVRYSTSAPPADKNAGTAWGTQESGNNKLTFSGGVATVSNGATFNQIYIALFATDGTLYDRETVLIVRDGSPGNNGETIKTVTVYKRSDTQPATPTGSTIPPAGWGVSAPAMSSNGSFSDVTSGNYAGWRKATGGNNDNAFIKDTITFVTTSPNEVVRIAIKASSEKNYDFIFVGNLGTDYAARPADMGNISDSRKASGEESKIVSITVPTAGEHTLCVIYTKDGSDDDGSDCGWYKVLNTQIWSSMATFKDDVLQGSWSTPVKWNGQDGNDGNDGEDGEDAWTVQANPSPLIIQQSTDGSFPMSENNPLYIDFTAKHGNAAATVTGISNVSNNNMGLAVTSATVNSVKKLEITGYNKVSGAYVVTGRITCTVSLSHGGKTATMNVAISVGVNLLGEFKREVIGDVETSVATKLTNAVNGEGEITVFNQVGTYIRSASENTARLTETVGARSNGNNLFGFSKGVSYNGIRFVQGYGFVTNLGSNTQFGMARLGFNAQTGYYVVTCEAKMLSAARNITFAFWGYGDVLQTRSIGTNWTKLTMVFRIDSFPDAVDAKAGYFYSDGVYDGEDWTNPLTDSNRLAIRYLQIEHGSVPSAFGICAEDAQSLLQEPVTSEFVTASDGAIFYNDPNNDLNGLKHFRNRETYNDVPAYWQAIDNMRYINIVEGNGGSVYNVESGSVYTLSFWAKGSINGMSIHSYLYAASGQTPIIDNFNGVDADTDDNTGRISVDGNTETFLTTSWKKYYIHWYIDKATGPRTLIVARLEGYTNAGEGTRNHNNLDGVAFICGIRFDKGYVTSANRTEYQTVMRQTARAIDFAVMVNSMEKAGIHLYTESNGTPENEAELAKGIIDLVADKVAFSYYDNGTKKSDKISINPTTGTLTAVDGNFSGTMTAAGGAMFFGNDGSWTGMATVDSVVGGFADIVTVGMRNDGTGEEKTGRIVLTTAKKKDGVLRLSSMLKIENNNGTPGQSASGGNDGYKLTFTNILEASGKEDKIILDGGDGSGTFAGGVSAGTVEANYLLAKAGYKIQTADILTVSSQPSGSISTSYQMIIVNTASDITLTLSSTASAGQLMIIKKTTESGWVTVKNSGGTQIGKFNCGSLVCVYNSGWQ